MAKDSELKRGPKYKELYGTIMQATTLDTERKNLQWLTNRLIEAAKEAIILDKSFQAQGSPDDVMYKVDGKDIKRKDVEHFTHFNDFIKELEENHGIIIEGNNYRDLKATYYTLKTELEKTRVLGVGKNLSQKIKTGVANTFKRIIPKAILGAFALGTGPILAASLVATGVTPVSELGAIRSKLKKQLRQVINQEDDATEALGTIKKIGKRMLGISTPEPEKKLQKIELWKKKTPQRTPSK